MAAASTLDWILAGVLLLSMGIGGVRGLVFEMMGLAGWVVAYFGAAWLAPRASVWIPVGAEGSSLNQSAAMVVSFLVVLIAWGLLARVVRWLVAATPLSLMDRALGGVFGLLRGGVLLLALTTVVLLTPAAQSRWWSESQAAPWLAGLVKGIKPLLPPEIGQWLPA
jgi:membrane protein required for colicin V production